jgi:hypothetical protein
MDKWTNGQRRDNNIATQALERTRSDSATTREVRRGDWRFVPIAPTASTSLPVLSKFVFTAQNEAYLETINVFFIPFSILSGKQAHNQAVSDNIGSKRPKFYERSDTITGDRPLDHWRQRKAQKQRLIFE